MEYLIGQLIILIQQKKIYNKNKIEKIFKKFI